ncbi:MAG: hypothetical protein AAF235_11675, partial [Planctomycetota bacterium]
MMRLALSVSAVAALAVVLAAPVAAAQDATRTFTYQGVIEDDGSPLNGLFDFNASVWDAETGGNQLYFRFYDDVPVTDGVFTLEVPDRSSASAAGAFTGADRWLSIGVRPGASGSLDPYEFFAPRTEILAVPYAMRSLSQGFTRSEVADLGIGPINAGDGDDRVLINRNGPITPAEFFGVTAISTADGFGGMYMNASALGVSTRPFYGYAENGSVLGWTEISTPAGGFGVTLAGAQQLTLSTAGLLTVSGVSAFDVDAASITGTTIDATAATADTVDAASVTAQSFLYETAENGTLVLGEQAFRVSSSGEAWATNGSRIFGQPGSRALFSAVIDLPIGAEIESVRVIAEPGDGELFYSLRRFIPGAAVETLTLVSGFAAADADTTVTVLPRISVLNGTQYSIDVFAATNEGFRSTWIDGQ